MKQLLAGCLLSLGLLIATATYAQTPTHTPPSNMTCPGDKVVWVNSRSHIYHYQGERYFGSTKEGKFLCEKAAEQEGDRATRNGQ
jgi:hypothetical protein